MEFTVASAEDFAAVEAWLSAALSSEGPRCSFVRSAPFVRFRVRVLYRQDEGGLRLCPPQGNVALDFAPPNRVIARFVE